jgi:transcriptional regulator with XRE-family HTH domain
LNTDKTESSLGGTIKSERSRQKLSLDNLAQMSGVSKGMLSQIERGKTNPTVAVLYKIAAGLRVEPSRLLPTTPKTSGVWRVIRSDDDRYVFIKNKNCRIRTLSPLDLEKQIEFYEITFMPKGELVSEAHYHGTEEILTVAQGRLHVRSGDHEAEIVHGDSVHFSADVAHRITNMTAKAVTAYLLVRYRS